MISSSKSPLGAIEENFVSEFFFQSPLVTIEGKVKYDYFF